MDLLHILIGPVGLTLTVLAITAMLAGLVLPELVNKPPESVLGTRVRVILRKTARLQLSLFAGAAVLTALRIVVLS
jgi:hypothetical protein